MGAPKGNKFWNLRSKHGRDRLFKTPTLMWDAACEYFEWCYNNPWTRIEYNGKDAIECSVPTERPFTLQGLCGYLNCNTAYFRQFKISIAGKKDKISKDFSTIITRIEETIYQHKFEGAAVGAFNANLISRDLGLADKSELKAEIKQPVNEEQLQSIVKKINNNAAR